MRIQTQTLGFPRIGLDREMKRALEGYWDGRTSASALWEALRTVEEQGRDAQEAAGVDWIGVGDVTFYDHVLDWALTFGLIPDRFKKLQGLALTFAMARGADGIAPLELTKWFDTNYHYLVPEISAESRPTANFDDYLAKVERAQSRLGGRAVPMVLGPITLLALARLDQALSAALDNLLPLYRELLQELRSRGVGEVQMHEPALVLGQAAEWKDQVETAIRTLAEVELPLNLVTTFDDLGQAFPWLTRLPCSTISLDFTRGDNLALIRKHGWPEGVVLGAGVVDGRNVWRIRPRAAIALLEELRALATVRVGPSCSLMFVPYRAARENHLPAALRGALAFAEEKLAEVSLLARAASGEDVGGELQAGEKVWEEWGVATRRDADLQRRLDALEVSFFQRASPYRRRRSSQIELPRYPTTTIGSFPQTAAIRSLRSKFKRGEIDEHAYRAGIDNWIGYTIGAQEGLGLDVLVHGEFERSDMVEYFAEKMKGFAFTRHGWVQSYGNRYVRPPVIWADVQREQPMTVREFRVAQSFTERPVKGMLTGPVTILNWSFPRVDIPRKEVAFQIALALRDEIADLEAAGAKVIQVDEPALREGLPLKPERWQEYLEWAVDAFRLTTAGAQDRTQIHTHMCYAEFGEVLEAIDRMDADVISIENTRSGDANLIHLSEGGYQREVGPGVYDVHSGNVPDAEEVKERLQRFLQHLRPEQIWVNPDCGLKTRTWEDVLPSLGNIVKAVRELRAELAEEAEQIPAGD